MHTYIIAEVGQNHQGSLSNAKKLIDVAASKIEHEGKELPGVDAVKFTVRDLKHECSPEQWNAPYDSPNSFGKTYGEHRAALEFNYEQIKELRDYAKSKGLDFILTLCQDTLVEQYAPLADKIKVASRDINNIPLLKKLSELDKEIIVSTGFSEHFALAVDNAIKILDRKKTWLLYCVSKYPTSYNCLNFSKMLYLNKYKVRKIGFSDHSTGILAPALAVMCGAKVIEKHITLNRNQKGSDHLGSLSPAGLKRCVRDIRNAEIVFNRSFNDMERCDGDYTVKQKIGRSLAVRRDIKKGEIFKEEDFIMVSPGTGFPWSAYDSFIGKPARKDYKSNELL
jgi:sialic acid synthase